MGNGATWGRFEPGTENPKKMNYEFNNHGHNILRLFDTLPSFTFTASEAKCGY